VQETPQDETTNTGARSDRYRSHKKRQETGDTGAEPRTTGDSTGAIVQDDRYYYWRLEPQDAQDDMILEP